MIQPTVSAYRTRGLRTHSQLHTWAPAFIRLVILVAAGFAVGASGSAQSPVAAYKALTLAQLMDVEVTSVSRRAEVLADAASAVQVVTGDDILRAGARRIPTALRLLANVEVAQIDARQWAITTRGFNNTTTNKLLVQMDGRTLYSPLFAGVFWEVHDTFMADIDQIEVISGPGATQWGSNAVNGIINVRTKNARDTQGGVIVAGAGTEPELFGSARYGGTVAPGVYYRVYGKHTERKSTILSDGSDAEDAWQSTQGGFRVDWERNSMDRLTLMGDTYGGRAGQLVNDDVKFSGANLIGRWRRTYAPKAEFTAQAYFDYIHHDIPGSVKEHLYIYNIDLDHRHPIAEGHDFVWGGAYRLVDDRLTNGPAFAFLPAEAKRYWLSGFVQDELSLLHDRLRLTAGVKVEENPYSGWEFQPSVRAGWKWRDQHLVWAAVSRALRTPSRIDRELFAPPNPPFLLGGGPRFVPETLIAYELGYRAEVKPGLSVSAATFYHDYDDLRSLEMSPVPGGTAFVGNGLEGKSYGLELSANYLVREGWRLRFGYTEMRVSSAPKPNSADRTGAGTQALDPNRMVVLHSQFDFREHTTLDISGRYVSRIEHQDVPSHLGIDVRVGWRAMENLELALTLRNLLDASHPEFGPPAMRREIERTYNVSATWRF